MELNIKFDGRSIIYAVFALVCLFGIYLGSAKALEAQGELDEANSIKEAIVNLGTGKLDSGKLAMEDVMKIGLIGMALKLNPSYLEDAIDSALKDRLLGIFILMMSVTALAPLYYFYRLSRQKLTQLEDSYSESSSA